MPGFHVTKHRTIKGFRRNGRTVPRIINPWNRCRCHAPAVLSLGEKLSAPVPVDLTTVEKKKTFLLPGIEH
jgi:hypothetical protein